MAAANGQEVICVTATKGELGGTDENLGEVRAKELAAALEILGVKQHEWLGYTDGSCVNADELEAVSQIVTLIDKYQPDTVITFPPDGLTGHPDHQVVSKWARKAALESIKQPEIYFAVHTQEAYDSFLKVADEQLNIYFVIDHPTLVPEGECDVLLRLEPVIAEQKMHALKAMPSQYNAWFEFLGDKGVEFALGTEALVSADNDARWVGL